MTKFIETYLATTLTQHLAEAAYVNLFGWHAPPTLSNSTPETPGSVELLVKMTSHRGDSPVKVGTICAVPKASGHLTPIRCYVAFIVRPEGASAVIRRDIPVPAWTGCVHEDTVRYNNAWHDFAASMIFQTPPKEEG